jgi:transketolase
MSQINPLEQVCINTIRILSADAVQHANSGHPGMPMGAAAMAYTLWTQFLKHNPKAPDWFDRDRFVLSAGHGSMLLYSLLHLTGYDLPLDELKAFRKWGSKTPGHPERGHTAGVEVTTGPLGQGFGNAVGMAIAEAWLAAKFNRPGHSIVDHHTYAIAGDGDLMEGVSQEAASLAGHLGLGKLVVLYDQNDITLAGDMELVCTEDVAKRFDAYGWRTQTVHDGNSVEEIAAAIAAARAQSERPFSSHGSPLGEEELLATKKALGWPSEEKFFLPAEAVDYFRQAVASGDASQAEWTKRFAAYEAAFPSEAAELSMLIKGGLPSDWSADLPQWKLTDKALATRAAGGQALNGLAKRIPNLMGGSADLNPSTETGLKGMGDFQSPVMPVSKQGAVGGGWGFSGRNIAFGVREHAMGAAVNGMAAHGGVIPFSATFLVFSDYMKPSIRLAALSGLQSIFVFTHDSVGVGEDGPTHEPVEQIAGLRAIPGLTVLRPADSNETAEAWAFAVRHQGPSLLVLSRQAVPHLDRSSAKDAGVSKGAYVLSDCEGAADVLLIGSGSEVSLCVKAQTDLAASGVKARVVSMPSWELFSAQSDEYRESVLPSGVKKRVTIEAGCTMGWHKWAGDEGVSLGIDRFGASAPGDEVLRKLGMSAEAVTAAALKIISHR